MPREVFDLLLGEIEPAIMKQDTNMRKSICPKLRLMSTLRFLTSGCDFETLSEIARISPNTLSQIIPDVCQAIFRILSPEYIVLPRSSDEWKEVAKDFEDLWDYPFCCGALDGKHCRTKCPPRSGSVFFNYKGFYSFVILVLCDAKANILYADIGQEGASNDSGIYQRSALYKLLQNGDLNMPDTEQGGLEISYHYVGDDCFSHSPTLFKPFPHDTNDKIKQMFNYRHSRARRIVECCFGILSHRFQVVFGPIKQQYENAVTSLKACVVLHNFLNKHVGISASENQAGEEAADEDDANMPNMVNVPQDPDENSQRLRLAKYFCTPEGEISKFDQYHRANRTSRPEGEQDIGQ